MYSHVNSCTLRKLKRDDLPSLLKLKESSWFGQHTTSFLNEEDQENWFDSIPDSSLYMICEQENSYYVGLGKVRSYHSTERIGLLSITNISHTDRRASIAGAIFPEKRETEWVKKAWQAGTDFAFEMLNLNRVEGEVLETNVASIALELAIGYTFEGKKRQAVYKSGRYLDSYTFGMLRGEWQASLFKRFGKHEAICNTQFKHYQSASKILDRAGVNLAIELPESVLFPESVPVDHNMIVKNHDVDGNNTFSDQNLHQAVS